MSSPATEATDCDAPALDLLEDAETESAFVTAPNTVPNSRAPSPQLNGGIQHDEQPLQSLLPRESTHSRKRKRGLERLPKSRRLKGLYNEEYRLLFNETVQEARVRFKDEQEVFRTQPLESSQLGVSRWTSSEKETFFSALSKLGRHDLPGIAGAIGSKSELEVHNYLLLLQQGLVDHHLKDAHLGILGFSDIPAAAEICEECCRSLDLAAEALEWHQDKFEAQQEKKKHGDYWLLTNDVADEVEEAIADLGEKEEEDEDNLSDHEAKSEASHIGRTPHPSESPAAASETQEPNILTSIPSARLLHLQNFIRLSSTIFMNSARNSLADNWRTLADPPGSSPAIHHTAFTDLHHLTISLTRRLVQAVLFQTQSRLRAEDWRTSHAPKPTVRKWDVHTAVDILGLKRDARQVWVRTAERCGVQVYVRPPRAGSKRDHSGRVLRYETVARYLEERGGTMPSEGGDPAAGDDASEEDGDSGLSDDEWLEEEEEDSTDEDDEYAEMVDQQAGAEEERALWKILGRDPVAPEEDEETKRMKRPHLKRKSQKELADWTQWTEYQPEWEVFGRLVPEREFAMMKRKGERRKRKRMGRSGERAEVAKEEDDIAQILQQPGAYDEDPDTEMQDAEETDGAEVAETTDGAEAFETRSEVESEDMDASEHADTGQQEPDSEPGPPTRRILQPRRAREEAVGFLEGMEYPPGASDDSADEFVANGSP